MGCDLCTCDSTLLWFLCCHASAIKKNCWMRVIERNNGLLQDVQDRVITVCFLAQSCYEQALYLPACFICQHRIISMVRLQTAHILSSIWWNKILSNTSVGSGFSGFIISIYTWQVFSIYLSSLVMTNRVDKVIRRARKCFTIKWQISSSVFSKMKLQKLMMSCRI